MKYLAQAEYVKQQFAKEVSPENSTPVTWEFSAQDTVITSCQLSTQYFSNRALQILNNEGYTLIPVHSDPASNAAFVKISVDLTKVILPNTRESWYKKLSTLKVQLQDLIDTQLRIIDLYDEQERAQRNNLGQAQSQLIRIPNSQVLEFRSVTETIISTTRRCITNIDLALAGKGMNSEQEKPLKDLASLLLKSEDKNISHLIQHALDVPLHIQEPAKVVAPEPTPSSADEKSRRENDVIQDEYSGSVAISNHQNTLAKRHRAIRKSYLHSRSASSAYSDAGDRKGIDEYSRTYLPGAANYDAEALVSNVGTAVSVAGAFVEAANDFSRGDISGGLGAIASTNDVAGGLFQAANNFSHGDISGGFGALASTNDVASGLFQAANDFSRGDDSGGVDDLLKAIFGCVIQ